MNKKTIFLSLVLCGLLVINVNSEPRRVLLEYCTGTWCGWCPCGHQAIANQILPAYPNTIIISYHGASSDPWQNFEGNSVRSLLGFAGYPTATFDRGNHPGNGSNFPWITYDMWMAKAQDRYNSSANTRVNIQIVSKNYNETTRELTATVNATALENLTGQYKIQFVVMEDNLIYQQNHYAPCGFTGYIPDYVHKHVARTMANGPTGENLNSGNWNQNQTLSKSVSKVLDAAWVAPNCKMVVFVFKDNAELYLAGVEQAIETPVTNVTGITGDPVLPAAYSLSQNYPNPFNPTTSIKFSIPKSGNVSLKIYNAAGSEIESLLDGFLSAGSYNAQIDGTEWSSGVYFYTLKTDGFSETKKMILVK